MFLGCGILSTVAWIPKYIPLFDIHDSLKNQHCILLFSSLHTLHFCNRILLIFYHCKYFSLFTATEKIHTCVKRQIICTYKDFYYFPIPMEFSFNQIYETLIYTHNMLMLVITLILFHPLYETLDTWTKCKSDLSLYHFNP